ncbi:MAG: non-heme iron oxygenase ferredoxin subunit [Chloroflexota bacterium]|nr:MAG: (2Fe-2S)-binding protein [Chloroflexota bacterium]
MARVLEGLEWVKVADISEIVPDMGLRVEIDEYPVAIWNIGGAFYATDDTCSHEEASLSEGDVWDGNIECPLHGSQFDPETGAAITLPAVLPIATFPIKIDGNDVYVGWRADR